MTKDDEPISNYSFKYSLDPGIQYAQSFAEYECCLGLGLDIYKWEKNEYPTWFKAKAIAFYNLHSMINAVKNDVAQADAERKARQQQKG